MVLSSTSSTPRPAGAHAPWPARIVALRWLMLAIAALPGAVVAWSAAAEGPAVSPYLVAEGATYSAAQVARTLAQLNGPLAAALGIAAALGFLFDQLLTAGALLLLDDERPRPVRRAVFADGAAYLVRFLRLLVVPLLVAAIGSRVIGAVSHRISEHGHVAGWTGATLAVTLPLVTAALLAAWWALVASWVFWTRIVLVSGGRTRVLRTSWIALRFCVRRRFAWIGYAVLSTIVVALPALVVLASRPLGPRSTGTALLWVALWLVVLAVQAWAWFALLAWGNARWADPRLDDLRDRPDVPERPWWRRWRRAKPAPVVAPAAE